MRIYISGEGGDVSRGEAGLPKPLGWAREAAMGSMAPEGSPVC